MIGSQVGAFTVVSELGSGGMGTVYLGEGDGKKVALKVVHPHLIATPGFFKRFLREAEVGKQVNHENVVRTLDVDATMVDDRQINYMVMEYVEGRSLRELLRDLGTVPETLLREIAFQIAEGVAAIHAEGIVHRDLKPENVLITDDHRIRIMDLGVAKLQEASVALTQEGQFAGSFLYAAPEQFSGGEVGLRADLYSIGVMLIELATGQNPFQHSDAGAVINAHLRTEPPRTADLNADYSQFFSELVATLLAKKPADRIDSSVTLISLFDEGEKSEWWGAREKELRTRRATLPKVTVRRDTDMHGREDEVALLRAAWDRAKEGHGNTILIEGEAGIGKTRLVDVLLRNLETEDAHFLYGSYPPTGGLGGLSESILGKFGEAGLEESLAPYLTVTPSLIPAFAALVKHEAPPTGSEPLGGDALHAIGCHLVRALAEEKPTVWVIEDLHSGPEDARGFLLALARAVGSHRVLLIATSRADLSESTMVNFQRLENFQRIELGRLGARDVIGLVQDALKSRALADKLGAQIAYKSDGVPFFVFELIRALKDGRLIKEMPDGTHVQTEVISDIEVPSAVKDLIESRLGILTKDERALLDVGAVQGYEFEPDLVARVLELKKIRVLQDLAEIERRTGLIHGEAGKCRFDQYQLQEVLYRALMPDLRTEYHAMLADTYAEREDIEDDAEGDEAYFLADHHLRGSRPKAARPYLDAALDWLEKTHRNDSAIELADRALAAKRLLKGAARVEVLLRKCARLGVVGRSTERRESLEEALAAAVGVGEPLLCARVHLARGNLEMGLGNFGAGAEDCVRARALAQEAGDKALEGQAGSELANILHFHGKLDQAYETISDALETARSAGDQAGETRATRARGIILRTLGRYAEAREECEKLLEQGDAVASGNQGDILEFLGELRESKAMSEKCLVVARERGDRLWETVAGLNLCHVAIALGRPERAREMAEGGLALARETGDRRLESYALAFLAQVDPARRFDDAIALRREIEYRPGLADDLVESGKHEAARGDAGVAAAHLDEALALGRELKLHAIILTAAAHRALLPGGDVNAALAALEEHRAHTGHAQRMDARFALWKATKDKAHLEEAHRLLVYLRDNAPEEDRESMIENVPLHRAITEAWHDRI